MTEQQHSPLRHFFGSSPESHAQMTTPQRPLKPASGIADEIFSSRRSQYSDTFPSYSSSPIRFQREQRELRDRRTVQQRVAHRDQHAMRIRGGPDNMEKFIMDSERMQELQCLSVQAQENAIPVDEVEKLENEYHEYLDDEELIEYVAQRERLEQELDRLLK